MPNTDIEELDKIVGNFISLKFDVETDEFSDGTLERWNNMKQQLNEFIQQKVIEARGKELDNMMSDNYTHPSGRHIGVVAYYIRRQKELGLILKSGKERFCSAQLNHNKKGDSDGL